MSIGYKLINKTKRQQLSYVHIPASTARELAGNSISAAMTTWYMLKNIGDEITFVPDQYAENEWPLKEVTEADINGYEEMTETVIDELIKNEIVQDNGTEIFDIEEPEIYIRKLKNIWER